MRTHSTAAAVVAVAAAEGRPVRSERPGNGPVVAGPWSHSRCIGQRRDSRMTLTPDRRRRRKWRRIQLAGTPQMHNSRKAIGPGPG